MKKTTGLIAISLIFICVVLLKLLNKGVVVPPRPMVKWSSVESASLAGEKMALFYYALMKQQDAWAFESSSLFGNLFLDRFVSTARSMKLKLRFHRSIPDPTKKTFRFLIKELSFENHSEKCVKGDRKACAAQRAVYKWRKKPRDATKNWISVYRVDDETALLFFKLKQEEKAR